MCYEGRDPRRQGTRKRDHWKMFIKFMFQWAWFSPHFSVPVQSRPSKPPRFPSNHAVARHVYPLVGWPSTTELRGARRPPGMSGGRHTRGVDLEPCLLRHGAASKAALATTTPLRVHLILRGEAVKRRRPFCSSSCSACPGTAVSLGAASGGTRRGPWRGTSSPSAEAWCCRGRPAASRRRRRRHAGRS